MRLGGCACANQVAASKHTGSNIRLPRLIRRPGRYHLIISIPDNSVMNKATDPLLITLSVLLAASVTAFFLGYIPYPYGLIVLGVFIVSRILHLKGKGK